MKQHKALLCLMLEALSTSEDEKVEAKLRHQLRLRQDIWCCCTEGHEALGPQGSNQMHVFNTPTVVFNSQITAFQSQLAALCAPQFLALSQSGGEPRRRSTISHKDTETVFSFSPSTYSLPCHLCTFSLYLPDPLVHINIQWMDKAVGMRSLFSKCSDEVKPGKRNSFAQISQCRERGNDAEAEKKLIKFFLGFRIRNYKCGLCKCCHKSTWRGYLEPRYDRKYPYVQYCAKVLSYLEKML